MNKTDEKKLVKLYRRHFPDDDVYEDDDRHPAIAKEMLEICKAKDLDSALEIIEWWGYWQDNREFVISARKSFKRLKLSEECK